jgi:hypothetical protein
MTPSKAMIAALALTFAIPTAALAQGASGSSNRSVPKAGDASTGGSGGGSTGVDNPAPMAAAPTTGTVHKKKVSTHHKKMQKSM